MNSWPVCALLALALGSSGCARANRDGAAPLARERFVSTPSSMAYVSTERDILGLTGSLRFGGPLGRSALYLKFPSQWRARGIPEQAFLTLSARESSAITDATVTLEAWRISADWQAHTLQHWSDKPSLAPPYARTRISASPAQNLRIDITELVRFAAQNPERDFGVAVIASASEGPGVTFSSGFAGGSAPRLELYFR
ncbi:MAG TPA: DNRLRE domain-containing protein [Polyangiaceae bacterium]|nr:DNRLRE domain-containing protein [Polyangiaceae bacterium]